MKFLEFQKVLKALRTKGMVITDEFVIVRKDIYDKQIEQLNRRMTMGQHILSQRPN